MSVDDIYPGVRVKNSDGDPQGTVTGVTVQSSAGTLHVLRADNGTLGLALEGDVRDTFDVDKSSPVKKARTKRTPPAPKSDKPDDNPPKNA